MLREVYTRSNDPEFFDLYDINRVEVELDDIQKITDVTIYFNGSDEPFGLSEFMPGTHMRKTIEEAVFTNE